MVKIKFKEGPHFEKLYLIKYVYKELANHSLKEAKAIVESGVIECPDHEYNNAIKVIEECGGIQICEQKPLPTKKEKVRPKPSMLIKPNKDGTGLIIESNMPISELAFQELEKNHVAWVQIVASIPFVVGLTQFYELDCSRSGKETNEFWSLLAVEVPKSHNTINEITSLSKTVNEIHTKILHAVYAFQDITKGLNLFIDDVNVETRTNSDN